MPRNERGQFTRNDISIPLPSLGGLYRILIIGILIFPWYAILKNKDYSTTLFSQNTQYYLHKNDQSHTNVFATAQIAEQRVLILLKI